MERVEKGLKDRLKKIQAIRMLGTGMDAGDLNEHVHEICLLLLLKVFRREITENPNRTRADLITMTEEIIREMKLYAHRDVAERLVDGVLWHKDPNRQDPFQCLIFDEDKGEHELYKFRYLKIDREHSELEKGGPFVYMLTEEAQEIIFITREILEEFGFDIEQFYTLQLIKSGNFHKAESSVNNLIARVRTLIRREKEYRRDILRDPHLIFMDNRNIRNKGDEEIKRQFEEEQKVFDDMFSWKDRMNTFPQDKKVEAELVFEELERARVLHNILAKLVVENMAYTVEVRVKYPDSFWRTSTLTFKNDIWKNNIVKNGLLHFDIFEEILNPLFSPEIDFIFPLDWAWDEQRLRKREEIIWEEEAVIEEEWELEEIDWEMILDIWDKVFDSLIEKGEFSIRELQRLDEIEKEKWLSRRINIDLFMMFVITEVQLKIDDRNIDERLELFTRLCNRDEKYKRLIGKTIKSHNEKDKKPLIWDEIFISPYKIFIEGGVR